MNALASVISVAGIAFTLLVLFKRFRVDSTRQKLFELRDQLFARAVSGEISFDSPAYIAARAFLNGSIRYTHRVSVARALISLVIVPEADLRGPRHEFEQMMDRGSPADQRLCSEIVESGNRALVTHVLWSPFAVFFVPGVVVAVAARFGFDLLARIMANFWRSLAVFDEMAYEEGAGRTSPAVATPGGSSLMDL
jgi:hypothetical protein